MVNYVIFFCINAKTDQFVVCKALISTVEFVQFFYLETSAVDLDVWAEK